MKRKVRIIITGNAKKEYKNIKEKSYKEKEFKTIFNSIIEKINILKENPQYGIHIQKNKIPKSYKIKYEINNLWKINIPKFFRIIYTIKVYENEIICLIIDILDHKEYNKKFKYKKK